MRRCAMLGLGARPAVRVLAIVTGRLVVKIASAHNTEAREIAQWCCEVTGEGAVDETNSAQVDNSEVIGARNDPRVWTSELTYRVAREIDERIPILNAWSVLLFSQIRGASKGRREDEEEETGDDVKMRT